MSEHPFEGRPLNEFSSIEGGKCIFCGREPEERFYSGSCESYLACDCPELATYWQAIRTVFTLRKPAEKRWTALRRQNKIKALREQLGKLEKEDKSA